MNLWLFSKGSFIEWNHYFREWFVYLFILKERFYVYLYNKLLFNKYFIKKLKTKLLLVMTFGWDGDRIEMVCHPIIPYVYIHLINDLSTISPLPIKVFKVLPTMAPPIYHGSKIFYRLYIQNHLIPTLYPLAHVICIITCITHLQFINTLK